MSPEFQSLQESLPIYERDGRRVVPATLSEVPLSRMMRFLFTVHYSQDFSELEPTRTVYAEIYAIQALDLE